MPIYYQSRIDTVNLEYYYPDINGNELRIHE